MVHNNCDLYHNVGCKECETSLLIPNWFDKSNCEDLIGKLLTDAQFEEFIQKYNSVIADKVSEIVRQDLYEYFSDL